MDYYITSSGVLDCRLYPINVTVDGGCYNSVGALLTTPWEQGVTVGYGSNPSASQQRHKYAYLPYPNGTASLVVFRGFDSVPDPLSL